MTTLARAAGRSLREVAGFDPGVVDDAMLDAAVRRRMWALGERDPEAYGSHVARDPHEREELLEELLVRESWFFRDRAPFDLLATWSVRWRTDTSFASPLRVLSAPCAGGEEPYSVALTLAGAGLDPSAYRIDAVDLSRRGLAAARTGRYPSKAVRDVPELLAQRFLIPDGQGHVEVAPELRGAVTWHHANLLASPELLGEARYQVIFCRNLLIYLRPDARNTILRQLELSLAPDGLLVVGHAECGLLRGHGLAAFSDPGAFAFRRSAPGGPHSPRFTRPRAKHVAPRATADAQPAPREAPHPATAAVESELTRIRELADRGLYGEAGSRAVALIAWAPASAEAHHWLGLIRAAEGWPAEARVEFARSLELDPDHAPSLEHLGLLLEGAGDREAAAALYERARKAGSEVP